MSNICAGIGRGQMFALNDHIARRREIHSLYMEKLSGLKGVTVFDKPSEKYQSNFWLTCIQVNSAVCGFSREDVRLAMDAANIETRPLWKPMHLQPVFAEAPYYGNGVAEHLFENGLCLPSGPNLTNDDIQRVVDVFKELYSLKAQL
jgi:dTDP-4-amino-4,6-dideoxygalactose transaminase